MALTEREPLVSAELGGITYGFCSEQCRRLFLDAPNRYVTQSQPEGAAARVR
jgi:YHS domain-containing protein